MKLKYDVATEEIICMGEMPNLEAGEGEAVVDVDFKIPSEPLNYFTFNGTELVRKDQSIIDQMILIQNFDPEKAIGREAQVFTSIELIRLMPCSYTINELIRFKNFFGGISNGVPYGGLKQILEGLVASGQILQSDSDKLAGILAEQGIIL